ncbi:hypothetical protein A7K94_0203275 [Modestobacter sp. VKM Ac-2676]|nr:hypothetical protein A7K94_0203275 [Modestobacter sp. VKM Ac-2676]
MRVAKVLVVEDEDVTRLMLESRLHLAGHRVRAAASADEAQAVMANVFTPDVIVSDMFMPGGSGLSLANSLRADPVWGDVPVIFLSGRALPGDVAAGAAVGATYLSKPVSMTSLTTAIDAALEQITSRDDALRDHLDSAVGGAELDDAERALQARLLTLFVEQAPALLDSVEQALRAGDAPAVEQAAHRLRGSATALGAGPLAALCESLEDAGREDRLPHPAPVLAALQRDLAVTCRVFTDLATELEAAPVPG